MMIRVTPGYILSNEQANGSYGVPILINTHSGQTFRPEDPIRAYPNWRARSAADALWKMTHYRMERKQFTPAESTLIRLFMMGGGA